MDSRRKVLQLLLFLGFVFSTTLCADVYTIVDKTSSETDLDAKFLVLPNLSAIDTLHFKDILNFNFTRDTIVSRGIAIDQPYKHLIFETTGASRNNTEMLASPVLASQTTPIKLGISSLSVKNTNLHIVNGLPNATANQASLHSFQVINFVDKNSTLTLDNAKLIVDPATHLSFASNSNVDFTVKGSMNTMSVEFGGLSSPSALTFKLESNSDLTIEKRTDFQAQYEGRLLLEKGSTLNIYDSSVQLTAKNITSRIDGATVKIDGTSVSKPASLELTNPIIKNSNITLGNNTSLRSYIHSDVSTDTYLGVINFEGNNSITIGDNAIVTSNSSDPTAKIGNGSFYFKDGSTSVKGNNSNGKFKADNWTFDNATLNITGVTGESDIINLHLKNKSKLVSTGNFFTSLSTLIVDDSELSGIISYGGINTGYMSFNNALIKNSGTSHTGGKKLKSTNYVFSGTTNIMARIDPKGTELARGINIYSYNDSITFSKGSVQGFNSAHFTLQAFKPRLSVIDYASGGVNRDGVYDLAVFEDGATSDSDTLNVTLDSSLPALAKITQVNTPSTNQKASVKFEKLPNTALVPMLSKPNQKSGVNLLVANANNGNMQAQNHLNNITARQLSAQRHPEPYSSYMTISLESTDMIMNKVLSHTLPDNGMNAGSGMDAGSGINSGDNNKITEQYLWMNMSYLDGDVDGENDLGDFSYKASILTIGRDWLNTYNSFAGAYISLSHQKMNEHDMAIEKLDGDIYHVGLYFHKQYDNKWNFNAVAGYGHGKNDAKDVASSSTAEFNSNSFYVGVMGSTEAYKNDVLVLSPEVGMKYIYSKQDSIKESGNPNTSYRIDSADAQSAIASVGLNARFANFSENTLIYPLAFIRYEHDFYAHNNNTHDIKAALISNPGYKQRFVGQNRGANILTTGLGLGSDINNDLQVHGSIVTSKNSHGKERGATVDIAYYW